MANKHKTKKLRGYKLKTPGGKVKIAYRKRKPSPPRCPITKKRLHGVPRLRQAQLNRLPKTKKRPERMFGGVLSPKGLKLKLKEINKIINKPLIVGQVCVKTTGKEAGKFAVVIDNPKKNMVLIDGQVKRRKCNVSHLEAVDKQIKIKANATTDTVTKELKKMDIKVKKTKPKKAPERIKKQRKIKKKEEEKTKKPKKVKKKDGKQGKARKS